MLKDLWLNMMWIFRNVALIKTNWEQKWQLAFFPLYFTPYFLSSWEWGTKSGEKVLHMHITSLPGVLKVIGISGSMWHFSKPGLSRKHSAKLCSLPSHTYAQTNTQTHTISHIWSQPASFFDLSTNNVSLCAMFQLKQRFAYKLTHWWMLETLIWTE